ncbi:MAG: hydrogenase expression/formation protein HypD [Thermoanaerobaculia bacterium]|nr:hydrogenase expression/formation protein HypD [Thermoanaerobaculia bacterium]
MTNELQFRDPALARSLAATLARLVDEIGRPVAVMHVCGSHEQAIARFGLRSLFPKALDVIMGPGCPVCVTDVPEVDEGVVLARQGVRIVTFGDMLRVPGTVQSLADAQASGGNIEVIYSPRQAIEIARKTDEEVVLFATGFETTAVATAAVILDNPPPNFSVLSAHKYIPPVMEIVAEMPGSRVEGFLAAGHAAAITGSAVFEPFVERHQVPVVIAGFEPMDILAGLVELLQLILNKTPRVANMFPRCVSAEGNIPAQKQLWRVFEPVGGKWRGIAHVPNGNLRLRDEFAHVDARKRFTIDLPSLWDYAPPALAGQCICGEIMSGIRNPRDCRLFNRECVPETPVGACMVSNEGTCKIWHLYGGVPDLEATA